MDQEESVRAEGGSVRTETAVVQPLRIVPLAMSDSVKDDSETFKGRFV